MKAITKPIETLPSQCDRSVNFIFANGAESRFVQRTDDYFICYLSTHNGCNKACRFCHLTQTGQTSMDECSIQDMIDQAVPVLEHYRSLNRPATKMHFNFMARGEALASRIFRENANQLFEQLTLLAEEVGLPAKFNISTIMPLEAMDIDFTSFIDNRFNHQFYYSLYSMDPTFRKRWLPKAMAVEEAINLFSTWQMVTNRDLALHWAFIEGENDSDRSINEIHTLLKEYGLRCKFNLVRYNPFSDGQGREPDEAKIELLFEKMASPLNNASSRIVPRVGFDVKASCGMFVS